MARTEEEIGALYGLPLDEFTGARDALARSLRADGARAEADEVKRLRKPNLVAWALNRVRHRHPERVEELLLAGERLKAAQRQLVSGGERGLLRSAAAEERRLLEEVVALAGQQLAEAGHAMSATLQGKLWSTAHAAAAGTEAGGLLREGRLLHDYEVSDLGLPATAAGAGDVAERPVAEKPAAAKRPARRPRAGEDGARDERKRKTLAGQLERARSQAAELRQKAEDAEQQAVQARREAARAATALARAEASAERAQAGAERARTRVSAAAERVAELEQSLRTLTDVT